MAKAAFVVENAENNLCALADSENFVNSWFHPKINITFQGSVR